MRWLWSLALLLALPMCVGASEPAPAGRTAASGPATGSGPDLFLGGSLLHSGEANLKGWEISGSTRWRRSLRLVGDLSGHSGSFAGVDLGQLTFLAGVRYVRHEAKDLRPFGEALVGGARRTSTFDDLSSSATAWGGALGLGADYRIKPRWRVRGQVQAFLFHSNGGWDADPRLSVGVAYRFGR
jgi:hypothetical protein